MLIVRRVTQFLYSGNAPPTIRQNSRKLIRPSEKTSTWMTSLGLFQMSPMLVVLPKTYATSSCEAGSNNSAAIHHFPESEKETPVQKTRVLGQTWCLTDDTYTAPLPKLVPTPTTLRQRFSFVSSVFDPIGLLAPFVVQFKIRLQSLCKRGQKWDQMIPNDLHTIVIKLVDQYRNLPLNSVPRQLCQPCTHVQLHVFTDASI